MQQFRLFEQLVFEMLSVVWKELPSGKIRDSRCDSIGSCQPRSLAYDGDER